LPGVTFFCISDTLVPTTYLVDTTLSNSSDSDQTVQAVRLPIEKHERSTKDLVKAAVSGWLGTALEFMDFKSHTCQLFDKY
ncbi:TPA: hypothetical protein ACGSLU_004418, partial [Escherichia coli]